MILESRNPTLSRTTNCTFCQTRIEFSIPVSAHSYSVKCYSCLQINSVDDLSAKTGASPTAPPAVTVKDPEYYIILQIPFDASPTAIKKGYYKMAMLYHPDKSDDPEAESKFKLVSEAYQVLSDPQRRAAYDRNGKPSKESGGASFMDPQEFFQQQFGGDKFLDIIGEISLARDLKGMSNVPNEDQKHQQLTLQERIQIRTARVERLAQKLREKLDRYVNAFPVSQPSHNIKEPVGSWGAWDKPGIGNISWTSAQMDYEIDEAAFAQQSQDRALREFRQEIQREAADLKSESFGIELLHSIGFTYSLKAAQFQAKLDEDQGSSFYTRWMGAGNRWAGVVREKAHIVSETVETIKTAIDMQSSFAKIQELDKKSSSTGNKDQTNSSDPFEDRDRSKLEKEAAEKGLHAIWRGSKLEIESVLRDVCDTVFLESNEKVMDLEIYKRRVDALAVIGEVYSNVSL